ncbi:autotransporter outer membrane beta-barrel domain-containing protein [Salmonella enterica subsp. enterica]|nr:autotransporter outer membrane beta-barrel domain-containing protein [Salmonella enterica subsp. enterica]
MNRCYSIVWSTARNMYIVASEFSQGHRRACTIATGILLSSVGLSADGAYADELIPLSGATIIINNGDSVTSTTGGTAIDSTVTGGEGVQIEGKATLAVSGDSGSIGIKLDNGAQNNLGNGTQINITDTGAATTASSYGIYINNTHPGTNINADNLLIDVVSENSAYGINSKSKNTILDLGQGSAISVESGTSNATGVYVNGDGTTLTMNNGLIKATANTTGKAFGIDTSWADSTTLNLGDSTHIELNGGTGGGSALNLGSNTTLTANGLVIDFTATSDISMYGIQTRQGSHIDLGEGSSITLSSAGGTVYGLASGTGSELTADNLDISLITASTETASGRGADVNGSVDFGSGSTITVHGFSEGYGISVNDYKAKSKAAATATVTADNLTVDVTGEDTEGIHIEGGVVDLGSNSTVSANGTASTINLTGRGYGELNADNLTVTTSQATAISLVSNANATTINIGEGSTIDGRNASGSTTNGMVANTPSSPSATINFNGSHEQRNTIYAVSGYGASAQFSGSIINISNTDIIMSGDDPYGLWAIGDNAFNSAGVINANNVTIDMTAANGTGAGIVVQQGGIVNLNGDTTIKTADDCIAIWVPKVSSGGYILPGGTVNGTGKMMITGDIVNSGWGYINLAMAAGSLFEGATSVNDGFNAQGIDSVINISLADQSKWLIADDSTLTTLENAGTVELAADSATDTYSTLDADELTLQASSKLNIDLSAASLASDANAPLITGNQVALGGDLHITNTGDALDLKTLTSDDQLFELATVTLIDAETAITGNFDTISTNTNTMPDYISVSGQVNASDNTQYQLGFGLSWYAGSSTSRFTPAHGTFTLDEGQSFTVSRILEDVAPEEATVWNGRALTKEGDGTLILTADNTYSGGTIINAGTLMATNAGALGTGNVDNAGTLILDAQAEFMLADVTTRDNAITSITAGTTLKADSLTQDDGSSLNIALDSTSTSPIITAGNVNLDGNLNITGFNSIEDDLGQSPYSFTLIDADNAINGNFDTLTVAGMSADRVDFITVSGRISATDNTQYDLTAALSWYAGSYPSITPAHGTFTLSEADQNFTLDAALVDVAPEISTNWDGNSLTKKGAGALTLTANNTYSGATDIEEGTLWLTNTGVIGATDSLQAVNVASGAMLGGDGTINGNISNDGTLSFGDTAATNSDFTINGNLTNPGAITSSGTTPGNSLIINGDYTGYDGKITLNTYLGDDSSPTDQIIVSGDVNGSTTLYINQAGGEGALTDQGIEVVDVGGMSSDDAFTLGNQVQISLYEYRLYEDNESWYLRSQSDTPDDGGDVTPVDPDDGGDVTPVDPDDGGDVTPVDPDDGGDVTPVNPDDGDITPSNPQYRADIGAYLGNQWLARNLQMQTLYDREDSQYRSAEGNIWARFKGGNTDTSAVSGKVDIDSDYVLFQLGGDIAAWSDGQQNLTLGVMGSYIDGSTDSIGNRGADGSQFTASGDINGYNLGLYATWFADAEHHQGWYVDSWYQYGFYDNTVDNGAVGSTQYDSSANALSLESGYRYDITAANGNTISLTPQAQMVWQNYKADRVQANGTRIDGQNSDSWTSRLGLRVDSKIATPESVIQPFAEINWLHTTDDLSVSFDGAQVQQDLPANRAELKLGLQAVLSRQWSISAQATGQKGDHDYRDLNGSLNLRYSW